MERTFEVPHLVTGIMTPSPVVLPGTASVVDAACCMRDLDIGDVLVEEDGRVVGILTDRDIVVRVVAEGGDAATTAVLAVASRDLVAVAPDASVESVETVMRERALRRVPVIDGESAVGMVTLGAVVVERDRASVLADISSQPPNT